MSICFPADLRLIQEPFTDYLKLFNEEEKIQLTQQVKLTLEQQLTGAIALAISENNEANGSKIIGFCLFSFACPGTVKQRGREAARRLAEILGVRLWV